MKDFNQVYISDCLSHFKEGFINKWGLKEYTNPNKPSIFFGLYSQQDINAFIKFMIYLFLLIAISTLSYYFIEKPVLKTRPKYL